jgi:hypothetical protein
MRPSHPSVVGCGAEDDGAQGDGERDRLMPAFRSGKPYATFGLSVNQNAAGPGPVTPAWTVTDEDPTGQIGSGVVTIERTGFYLCTATFARGATATTGVPRVAIYLNGTLIAETVAANGAGSVSCCAARYLELEAGDQVTMQVNGHPTATYNILAAGTSFSVVRLGPQRWT